MRGLCSVSPDIVTNSLLAERADHMTATADRLKPTVPSRDINIPKVASTTIGNIQYPRTLATLKTVKTPSVRLISDNKQYIRITDITERP